MVGVGFRNYKALTLKDGSKQEDKKDKNGQRRW